MLNKISMQSDILLSAWFIFRRAFCLIKMEYMESRDRLLVTCIRDHIKRFTTSWKHPGKIYGFYMYTQNWARYKNIHKTGL